MLFIHVEFQHDSRHTFLLTDSAFNKVLNTFKVIILPVAVNPIFAAPSLGLVWTVWVSTGKPEKRETSEKNRSDIRLNLTLAMTHRSFSPSFLITIVMSGDGCTAF